MIQEDDTVWSDTLRRDSHGKKPKSAQEICDHLEEIEILKPGAYISHKLLETFFGEFDEKEAWNFLGPYLALKQEIESRGYFATSRKTSHQFDLRILHLEEMVAWAKKRQHSYKNRYGRMLNTMRNAPIEDLEDRERTEHMFESQKLARTILSLSELLNDSLN